MHQIIKRISRSRRIANAFLAATVALTGASLVVASSTTQLTHTINAGTLATDIRDSNRDPVANPSVAFSTVTSSFDCLTGGNASTGTLGTNDERLYVDNPDAADNGWTLTVAATSGATATWDDGGSNTHDFNDPTGTPAGCDDGADGDSVGGQLTVDASGATLTTDCQSCNTTGITQGSSTGFNQGTTDSVTLLNAGGTSSDYGRWYLTGASLSQTIPASTPAGSYTLDLTLTVTAS